MKVGSHRRTGDGEKRKVARAKKAESLLSNSIFKEAFDKLEQKVDEGWKGTADAPSTPETRERAYLMHRLLVQLRREFEVIVREGKSAARLLDEMEQERDRAKPAK